MLILIIAAFGSVLTIASLIYAKINKKYNFDEDEIWLKSTLFVLNVAAVDIVYCLLFFAHLVYALRIYLQHDVGDTYSACKFFVLGHQDIACMSGWSIALAAFSGAIPKIR